MVDTRNINEPAPKTDDKLISIFERQEELLVKYRDIEGMPDLPLNIDVFEGQVWIKDFLWRIVEELIEAGQLVTADSFLNDMLTGEDRVVLFQEEIADAFHFLVELALLVSHSATSAVGIFGLGGTEYVCQTVDGAELDMLDMMMEKAKAFVAKKQTEEFNLIGEEHYTQSVWPVLYQLGMVGTTLKNKKWKQSQMVTDGAKFKKHLSETFFNFYIFLYELGFDSELVYQIYFKKSKVNAFRQDSNY